MIILYQPSIFYNLLLLFIIVTYFVVVIDGKEWKQQQQGGGQLNYHYPHDKTEPIIDDEGHNNILRRVWIHFKDGQHDDGIRTIQNAVANNNNDSQYKTLKINYDFPNVNSMVVTGTEDDIKHMLMNNPNIEKITNDPIRTFHRYRGNKHKQRNLLDWVGQAKSYGIDLLNVPEVWDMGVTGHNVTVCVIDSGIDTNHEDFIDTTITGDDLSLLFSNWTYDDEGHGTHVSGIIAANNNDYGLVGIAYDANIHLVKVFDDRGGFLYSSALIDAVYKCRDVGAKIISMSLGGDFTIDEEREVFTELYIDYGILSIASSGNYGDSTYSYPASYSNVISVGAINRDKEITSFSQYNDKVDLVAPGFDIWSTIPMSYDCVICEEEVTSGYVSLDGTSFAAPHVSALAALLWSYDPTAPVTHIHNALLASGEDLGSTGRDNFYGHGLPRANVALRVLNDTLNGNIPLQDWNIYENVDPSDADFISCSSEELLVSVTVMTDYYGNETSWEVVRDVDDFTVMSGAGLDKRKLYHTNHCLPQNCYTFTIYDSFGDGIDGEFGNGFYNVSIDGTNIVSGGNFSSFSESTTLTTNCIPLSTKPKPPPPACVEVSLRLRTDGIPGETSVILENTEEPTETYWSDQEFLEEDTEYNLSACIDPNSCYRFEISDRFGDGICCLWGIGLFELSYDGAAVYSGGNFAYTDSVLIGGNCLDQI